MVHDGDDAVFWATEQEFDAIILDVMLPGRDGFAVCRDLRAKAVQTPVLMLTARGSVEDRIGGLDAGADADGLCGGRWVSSMVTSPTCRPVLTR